MFCVIVLLEDLRFVTDTRQQMSLQNALIDFKISLILHRLNTPCDRWSKAFPDHNQPYSVLYCSDCLLCFVVYSPVKLKPLNNLCSGCQKSIKLLKLKSTINMFICDFFFLSPETTFSFSFFGSCSMGWTMWPNSTESIDSLQRNKLGIVWCLCLSY